MAAPDRVLQLVKLFEDNIDDYHADAFKERLWDHLKS
jgi:hypothetical protein